jgi:uncharacterized membrane-anchored protein
MTHEPATDIGRNVIDAAAMTITVGAIVNILPSIATVLTIVWVLIRIWESDTVQRAFKRNKEKDNGRKPEGD